MLVNFLVTSIDGVVFLEQRSVGMQSAIKVLRTLEMVADHQPIGVGELSRIMQLPKSTVQRCLVTLEDAGWIWQAHTAAAAWSLSAHAVSVGRRVAPDLVTASQEPLRKLRDQTGETVHLTVRDADHSVVIDRIESSHVLRIARPFGDKTVLHATASGRAMLSLLGDEEIRGILPENVQALTPDTVTDREQILTSIREVRKQGYAVNRGQNELGVCAIGAPIPDIHGRPMAAIVVSVPSFRFPEADVDHWGQLVSHAAATVSRTLGVQFSPGR